jgi:hypothetical protein
VPVSLFFFFFGKNWGLNSGLCSYKAGALPHLQSILLWLFLEIRVYPGWPPTGILRISACQVARITGVSHHTQLVGLVPTPHPQGVRLEQSPVTWLMLTHQDAQNHGKSPLDWREWAIFNLVNPSTCNFMAQTSLHPTSEMSDMSSSTPLMCPKTLTGPWKYTVLCPVS